MVWSFRGHSPPEEPPVTIERQRAADAKRAAMLIKSLYVAGHSVNKEAFRVLFIQGEEQISSGPVSGITRATGTLLNCFPVDV